MTALDEKLQSFVGQSAGDPTVAPDPVNQPMIRHWVEAMGDFNPVYVDDEAARRYGFPGVIAPPTMLQAWIMRGLRASLEVEAARAEGRRLGTYSPMDNLMALLDEAGFTSVVATNCEQHYERPLVLGDLISATSTIDSISPEKKTALGVGHFVTTRLEYRDQRGDLVATMRFRILKFRPPRAEDGASPPAAQSAATAPSSGTPTSPGDQGGDDGRATRPRRPRPALTHDNRFFFEGARHGKLLIQRCTGCGTLRHPPRPACAECRSFEWDTVAASGRGTVYSYVVNHHPQVPAFDYPLVVALVELEEGTRLVANLSGVAPEDVRIGLPVAARFEAFDEELTLPVFHLDDPGGPDDPRGPGGPGSPGGPDYPGGPGDPGGPDGGSDDGGTGAGLGEAASSTAGRSDGA